MKALLTFCFLATTLFSFQLSAQSQQQFQSRYAIETTLDGKTPAIFEENYAGIRLNPNTGDISFLTDLANLKTGNAKTDSLVKTQGNIMFTFQGNMQEGLQAMINDVNNDKYHKVEGTVLVNSISYPMEAYVKIDNFSDRSNLSKALMDFKITIDPQKIQIPYLSDYFQNDLQFQLNDGLINLVN